MSTFLIAVPKIVSYLLDPDHPDGGPKCLLFMRYGFSREDVVQFGIAMTAHGSAAPKRLSVTGRFSPKLVVEGPLHTPCGKTPNCVSIWEHDEAEDEYRLITAYIR